VNPVGRNSPPNIRHFEQVYGEEIAKLYGASRKIDLVGVVRTNPQLVSSFWAKVCVLFNDIGAWFNRMSIDPNTWSRAKNNATWLPAVGVHIKSYQDAAGDVGDRLVRSDYADSETVRFSLLASTLRGHILRDIETKLGQKFPSLSDNPKHELAKIIEKYVAEVGDIGTFINSINADDAQEDVAIVNAFAEAAKQHPELSLLGVKDKLDLLKANPQLRVP
jgi:hypothetical protein